MNNLSLHGFRAADEPSRRGFLITIMGAGIMLGYARKGLADQSPESGEALFEPTIWYGIDRSGAVTVHIVRAELGQYVGTSLGLRPPERVLFIAKVETGCSTIKFPMNLLPDAVHPIPLLSFSAKRL